MNAACWIWDLVGKSLHGSRITPQVAFGNALIELLVRLNGLNVFLQQRFNPWFVGSPIIALL